MSVASLAFQFAAVENDAAEYSHRFNTGCLAQEAQIEQRAAQLLQQLEQVGR